MFYDYLREIEAIYIRKCLFLFIFIVIVWQAVAYHEYLSAPHHPRVCSEAGGNHAGGPKGTKIIIIKHKYYDGGLLTISSEGFVSNNIFREFSLPVHYVERKKESIGEQNSSLFFFILLLFLI